MSELKTSALSKILSKKAGEPSEKPESKTKEETKFDASSRFKNIEQWHNSNPFYRRTIHPVSIEKSKDDFWTKPTALCCWYCGYSCRKSPHAYPMPLRFVRGKYEVSGIYCSPSCVKSELLRDRGYYFNERLEALTMMLHDVYNYYEPVATVDKTVFKRYGGTLSHARYLKETAMVCSIQALSAPFVDVPLVLQEDFKDLVMLKPKPRAVAKVAAKTEAKTEAKIKEEVKVAAKAEAKVKESGPVKMDTTDHAKKNFEDLVPVVVKTS